MCWHQITGLLGTRASDIIRGVKLLWGVKHSLLIVATRSCKPFLSPRPGGTHTMRSQRSGGKRGSIGGRMYGIVRWDVFYPGWGAGFIWQVTSNLFLFFFFPPPSPRQWCLPGSITVKLIYDGATPNFPFHMLALWVNSQRVCSALGARLFGIHIFRLVLSLKEGRIGLACAERWRLSPRLPLTLHYKAPVVRLVSHLLIEWRLLEMITRKNKWYEPG